MKISNILALKRHFNFAIILAIVVIFFSVLAVYFFYNVLRHNQKSYENQKIESVINGYRYNLSQKLSIVASSAVFLDYLRSGETTRKILYPQFLAQLSTLEEESISGMELLSKGEESIFFYGKKSDSFITLDLCYLNQTLDAEMGVCSFLWKIYFIKTKLLEDILYLNDFITICENCSPVKFITDSYLNSFHIKESSDINFKINMKATKNDDFYTYLLIIMIVFFLFILYVWYLLSNILNNYIANPIKNLADCLRTNEVMEKKYNIDEIQYLIDEVNKWKQRVKHASEVEHAARIGKIAAQLAHDIRSPLMSVDMVISNMDKIPDNERKILEMALSRISDIANGFLKQYRFKGELQPINSNEECLATLLKSIIDEKKMQYTAASIDLIIDLNAKKAASKINAPDFKRVISNLIDNSVEAADRENIVQIKLSQFGNFNIISIADSGYGISPNILPHIFDGVSRGKKNGNGLGLSHAKTKIEEWGGEICIQSEINSGTIITLTLPLYVE